MSINLPENAFEYFKLSPQSSQNEVMGAVMKAIKENPKKMLEIAEKQKLLLNPGSRFLIEFLYYLNLDALED